MRKLRDGALAKVCNLTLGLTYFFSCAVLVGKRHREDVAAGLTLKLDLGNWSDPPLDFEMRGLLDFPAPRSSKGAALRQKYGVETIWTWYMIDPVRTSIKSFKIWQAGAEIYSSCVQPPKTSLVSSFPCFLNLLPTNLEWSTFSLVSLCSPSMGAGFRLYLGISRRRCNPTNTAYFYCLGYLSYTTSVLVFLEVYLSKLHIEV